MHPLQGPPPDDAVHQIHEQLLGLAVPLDALEHDPMNARDHDDRNLDGILLSYAEHGQRKPIVAQVRPDGVLRVEAGNGQLEAVRRMGWTHIAVVLCDEPDVEAVKYAIRDNRTAELAAWNLSNLGEQMRYLQREHVPLQEVGFEPYEYEPLLSTEWEPPGEDPEEDDDIVTPERRVGLMFTRKQWGELKELLAAKPSAEGVLARLRDEDE